METRRKRKESKKTELVTFVKGQIVYCFWKEIWWPGEVEEVLGDVYQISFWDEEEIKIEKTASLKRKIFDRH